MIDAVELPEWPEVPDDLGSKPVPYLIAREAYWESRCRFLIDAIRHNYRGTTHWPDCDKHHWYCRALKDIGELPVVSL